MRLRSRLPRRLARSLDRSRLAAFVVLAALLAQSALPALHAARVFGRDAAGPAAHALALRSGPPELSRAGAPTPVHDPATCPVCQSLLRANPAALTVASGTEPRDLLDAAPVAPAARDTSAVTHSGHPPRAPPPPLSVA